MSWRGPDGALLQTHQEGSRGTEWGTPRDLAVAMVDELSLDLDAAALHWSRVVPEYLGPDHPDCARQDSLGLAWHRYGSAAWLNPPYSRRIGRWLQHASEQTIPVCVLTFARTDTRWWHELVMDRASEVRLMKGRLAFLHPSTHEPHRKSPAPVALVIYRPACTGRTWIRACDTLGRPL